VTGFGAYLAVRGHGQVNDRSPRTAADFRTIQDGPASTPFPTFGRAHEIETPVLHFQERKTTWSPVKNRGTVEAAGKTRRVK